MFNDKWLVVSEVNERLSSNHQLLKFSIQKTTNDQITNYPLIKLQHASINQLILLYKIGFIFFPA